MSGFEFTQAALDLQILRERLSDPGAGAYASFEGWVRNQNEGKQVLRLEYEAYETLGIKEGEKIVAEARGPVWHYCGPLCSLPWLARNW